MTAKPIKKQRPVVYMVIGLMASLVIYVVILFFILQINVDVTWEKLQACK